jgi:dienelactone hydrolase
MVGVMSEQSEREAILREIAKKRIVYRAPGIDALPAPRALTYQSTSGSSLPMQVHYPASSSGRVPVVLAPLAFPDPEAGVRAYGPFTSWMQLLAASGMAAVIYGTEAPDADLHAALNYLRADADALGLDPTRLALFATSGNVTVALSALMHDPQIRCAALFYGYTMDLGESTVVADMSRQYGFVNACAGRSVNDLPDSVPMLFVRAGREHFPGVNDALDRVIAAALTRNLPFTLINHSTGAHGFDLDEDTDVSRGIIQQVVAFLRFHLDVETS